MKVKCSMLENVFTDCCSSSSSLMICLDFSNSSDAADKSLFKLFNTNKGNIIGKYSPKHNNLGTTFPSTTELTWKARVLAISFLFPFHFAFLFLFVCGFVCFCQMKLILPEVDIFEDRDSSSEKDKRRRNVFTSSSKHDVSRRCQAVAAKKCTSTV